MAKPNPLIAAAIAAALTGSRSVLGAETGDSPVLQEVVVTANRREENVLTVPYNISAISAQQIEAAGLRTSHDAQTGGQGAGVESVRVGEVSVTVAGKDLKAMRASLVHITPIRRPTRSRHAGTPTTLSSGSARRRPRRDLPVR